MAKGARRGDCLVYGSALAHRGGTGVYLRRLLRGLGAADAPVRVVSPGGILTPDEALEFRGWSLGPRKLVFDYLSAPRIAEGAGAGAVHLPAFAGRPPRGTPCVVTVHDMAYLAGPSWFPPLRSLYYRMLFTRVARAADLVMTDSAFTGREAVRLAGVDPGRIRTVHLCADNSVADPAPLLDRLGLEAGYILYVGTVEPRKNLPALLDALRMLREQGRDISLLVAGRWGWGSGALRRRLSSQPGVLWAGPLGRRDLERAYCGASLLVYPSLYEGFGLPPLEAARAGVPTVVGPAEALREIYAGAAFHSAADPASLAETVEEALESPAPAGMEDLAERLTCRRMARKVAEVYSELLP